MTISSRTKHIISYSRISALQTLLFNSQKQRFNHTTFVGDVDRNGYSDLDSASNSRLDNFHKDVYCDKSQWRVVDSRFYGVYGNQISVASSTALFILRTKGFEAYLVGGCVRDLLLGRIPKDYDVITNATLSEIKIIFNRSRVVGRRFPICHVYIKGGMVEVSSFSTVAKDTDGMETVSGSHEPTGCGRDDFFRWQNCLHRDFTINSLFYDPSANKIYDYINGMRDLKSWKVQTVVPAHLSFKEDCARILRGLRIAARLGMSFSEETAAAINSLYLSILDLDKGRLMMEMDYMFSYGAAASSLNLLNRFKILDILHPFQAAYLSNQAHDQTSQSSPMLIKLFSSMDKLIACDRPCAPPLWIGVLAFHLALVNNPQDALTIWAFSSVLYHGKWKEAVKFAREKSIMQVEFSPEIQQSCCTKSDEELAEDISFFASQVISSIEALTEPQGLIQSMARYPIHPCSDFVYISNNKARVVYQLFKVLLNDIKSYKNNRKSYEINYELLKMGNCDETRFVLGKTIMDTMSSGVVQDKQVELRHLPSSHFETQHKAITKKKRCQMSSSFAQQKNMIKENSKTKKMHDVLEKDYKSLPIDSNKPNQQGIKEDVHLQSVSSKEQEQHVMKKRTKLSNLFM
ncbi:hypothetical protein AQUCO_01500383v1 [Aquilegia coerulea]|uniref:Poly A polymerase head domain-containing protein n=1 Tax=Aquilegia coerulea TaxID=218851 RepID=A0A2G5DTG9_AQUCA|nr:hypothetical protein AQUCO_01500383v1 [Aquilegia coerulea]